jgi:hypothetical protein
LSKGLKDDFSAWLKDNVGFRAEFIKTTAWMKLYAFHSSPTSQIHMGKDGWYFYTLDQNLDIAKGEYTLTDDMLKTIAANQQKINDYYKTLGVDYFLMLTPSKVSIYPEYIKGYYTIRETPVDILKKYLEAHTDVKVISPKQTLLDHKNKGKLFLQQDLHWTTLGSYYAYQHIVKELNADVMQDKPIDVNVGEMDYGPGEVAGMFGDFEILPHETAPYVYWDQNGKYLEKGEYYDHIKAICEEDKTHDLLLSLAVLENPKANYGRLLIYGDSQISTPKLIPNYMSEHYKEVVNVGISPAINTTLDEYVKPDTVIFSCSERYINIRLLEPPPGL